MINIHELDYSLIADRFNNAKVIKTNKKLSFYNLATSFDIETTSTQQQGEKIAFMYIWQFAFEDLVIYGRTWDEYQEFTANLVKIGKLNKTRQLVCYIHNFSFEFQFMRQYFNWENVFAVDVRKPIKATTDDGITYKDSYILSGYGLATLAKNLHSHKVKKLVGYLDYDKVRTQETEMTERELDYCAYDVIIVVDYIHEQMDEYGDVTKIPLTNTGRVRQYVKNQVFYDTKHHGDKKNNAKYVAYHSLMSNLTLEPETYNMLKAGFQGGFTHANANKFGRVVPNVTSVDFTSSYPTVMLTEKFPMSSPHEYHVKDAEDFKRLCAYNCVLFQVKLTNVTASVDFEHYLSASKCKTSSDVVEDNGRIVSCETLETTITEQDWEIIQQVYDYDRAQVGEVLYWEKDYLPKGIIQSIIKFYKDKTQLKGIPESKTEYMKSKGMLNSMYGMSVIDIVQAENEYSGGEWDKLIPDVVKKVEQYNNSKTRFLYYPWGVWVTAYARHNLWSGILNAGPDYCYSDTDSIKIENFQDHAEYVHKYNDIIQRKGRDMCQHYGLNPEDLSPTTIKGVQKPIGVWDYEGVYTHFKTLGAKRYLVEQDGKMAMTVAGLSKRNGMDYILNQVNGDFQKAFDYFQEGMYIPPENTGKNIHAYIDEPIDALITDYQGHQTHVNPRSGVHLSPTDYTLSISESYADYQKAIRQLEDGFEYAGETQILE